MKTHVTSLLDTGPGGRLLKELFILRKKDFVDQKGWAVASDGEVEWDCYDTPAAEYIILERNGECVGGARILCTTAPSFGPWSYMLRDAAAGVLPDGIPSSMLPTDLPVSDTAFEATRFTIAAKLSPKEQIQAFGMIVAAVHDAVADRGGRVAVALMPRKFYDRFRRAGFAITEAGLPAVIDGVEQAVGYMPVTAVRRKYSSAA